MDRDFVLERPIYNDQIDPHRQPVYEKISSECLKESGTVISILFSPNGRNGAEINIFWNKDCIHTYRRDYNKHGIGWHNSLAREIRQELNDWCKILIDLEPFNFELKYLEECCRTGKTIAEGQCGRSFPPPFHEFEYCYYFEIS
jgi:hypothetical protein